MKSFFKMLLASTLGVIIGSILLFIISFFIFVGIIASSGSSQVFKPSKNSVLEIDLNAVVSDRTTENPFASIYGYGSGNEISLVDLLDAIKKAKEDENIKGIYLKAGTLSSGFSSAGAIRKALIDFKESEKFVIAYGGSFSQNAYYIATVADKIMLNPVGMVDFHGIATLPTFYKGLTDKLGIQVEIFKVGTFKSAVEPFMLDKMSDANREQVSSYMGSIWENVLTDISGSRNISKEKLNALVDSGLLLKRPQYLLENGLVDELKYSTEATDYIKSLVDTEKDKSLNTASVQQMKSVPFKNRKDHKDKIAVLFAEGEITEAPSGAFSTTHVISDQEYVSELRKLKDNKNVKAVVFRVNSPGGSAYMSDQIWKEVVELKSQKPVVVSMGNYAASGGYYISCAADWIIAEPTTLTGSIGIFGIVPTFEGLMGKVGISSDREKTNTYSDLFDVNRAMRDDEKALMQKYVEDGYDIFITRCAEGRKKTKAEIDSIGQGRVWTGAQALKLGLVDELGGLDQAILVAAKRAELENYTVNRYPEEKDFFTTLLEESMTGVKINLVKSLLNETEFRHYTFLKNADRLDAVQARLPFDIEIK